MDNVAEDITVPFCCIEPLPSLTMTPLPLTMTPFSSKKSGFALNNRSCLWHLNTPPPSPPTGLVHRPPLWLVAIFWLISVLYRPSPWLVVIIYRPVDQGRGGIAVRNFSTISTISAIFRNFLQFLGGYRNFYPWDNLIPQFSEGVQNHNMWFKIHNFCFEHPFFIKICEN